MPLDRNGGVRGYKTASSSLNSDQLSTGTPNTSPDKHVDPSNSQNFTWSVSLRWLVATQSLITSTLPPGLTESLSSLNHHPSCFHHVFIPFFSIVPESELTGKQREKVQEFIGTLLSSPDRPISHPPCHIGLLFPTSEPTLTDLIVNPSADRISGDPPRQHSY